MADERERSERPVNASRRIFLRQSVLGGASLVAMPSLASLFAGCDEARRGPGYGPLVEKAGAKILLPEGFRYVEIGAAGSTMSDGNVVPFAHDGMAAFSVPGHPTRVRLVRNHELGGASQALTDAAGVYDATAPGGVTITEWDTATEEVVSSFLALAGTVENCNGGANHGARVWLTCEESTEGTEEGHGKKHGYVFAVPVDATGLVTATPIPAMGRFVHEVAVTDPATGFVYLTEDEGPDGFYRFVPTDRDDLAAGGVLTMLAIEGQDGYDTATGQTVGATLRTRWVVIADPDPEDAEENASAVLEQGVALGAATFAALEGAFFHEGSVYFVASEGGEEEQGQVWRFTPDASGDGGALTLLFESTDATILNQPDGIGVSPNGAVILCEDGDGEEWIDGDDSCRVAGDNLIRVLGTDGTLFDFAKVAAPLDLVALDPSDFEEDCSADPLPGVGEVYGRSETAGPCFSPDGKWLFVNLQYPGLTLAITGPWERGPI